MPGLVTRSLATSAPRKSSPTTPSESAPKLKPMLQQESSLPRLPVPTLSSTCAKYLETVRPHLTPEAYARTVSIVDKFVVSDQAKELQSRLEARAADPKRLNWLSEWWDDAAYMGYRDPVVVYVSYFFVHLDDKARRDPVVRAAALLRGMLDFRTLVESEQLEPDRTKDGALSMASFKWLFHSSRYPVKPSDTARKFDPYAHNHVVFLRKNKFYEVQLAHEGVPLNTKELEAQIKKVYELAGNHKGIPVGTLTSENRDTWADARQALLDASPLNAKALNRIESAMVVVCLDDTKPVTREEISWATWTGDGRNRFYDKHQLIIYENGRSGFLGEHSCMDGTPTLRMNEYILGAIAANKLDPPTVTVRHGLPAPKELEFKLDSKSKEFISQAEKNFDELIGKHELVVLHYEGYGKSFMKKHGISPDGWAQMVKQLAFQKMFNRPAVTYESAQTRKYQRGRTEVIRSASSESKAFAEAMLDPHQTDTQRALLFRRANVRHVQYSKWAADGQGVDRHLFGLKKLIKEGEPLPEIYKDEAFGKTNHWELSTSQLSSPFIDGWGYGEVVPDGYGLSYAIGDDYIRWTITSLKLHNAQLRHYLAEAATEVKNMMVAAAKAEEHTKAKL